MSFPSEIGRLRVFPGRATVNTERRQLSEDGCGVNLSGLEMVNIEM